MNATTERDHFLFRWLVTRTAASAVAVCLVLGVAGAIAVRVAQAQQQSDDATQVVPVGELQIPPVGTTFDELAPEVAVRDPAKQPTATADWEPQQQTPVSAFTQSVSPNKIRRYFHQPEPLSAEPGAARVSELVVELRAVAPGQRDKGKLNELRQLIEQQFGARHAEQQRRLERVLADAKQTEEMLVQRLEHAEQIVERRLSELLGERDPLNWDYQEPRRGAPGYTPTYPRPSQPILDEAWFGMPNTFVPQPAHIPAPQQPSAPPSTTYPLLPGTADSPLATVPNNRTPAALQPTPEDFITALRGGSPGQSPSAEDDLVRAAFAVQNAKIAEEEMHDLYKKNATSFSELQSRTLARKEAEARWGFKRKQLKSDIDVRQIELESIKQQLDSLQAEVQLVDQMVKVGEGKVVDAIPVRRELEKAQLQVLVAEINFRKAREQLEWAEAFQKELDLKADDE